MAVVDTKDGGFAIICTRGIRKRYCRWCRREANRLCDHEISPGKTCDANICVSHATRVGPNKDLCPDHARQGGHKAMRKAA